MAKIIDGLVEYMLAARSAKLPAEVIQKGKSHLLDTLAAIVSGSTLKPGKLGLQHAREQGGKEECSVLGTNLKTTAILAAFANGMSGHADETDDSNSQLHPGCAIVPASWRRENCTTERRGPATSGDPWLRYRLSFSSSFRAEIDELRRHFRLRSGSRHARGIGCLAASLFDLLRGPAGLRDRERGSATMTISRKPSTTPACRRATASLRRN